MLSEPIEESPFRDWRADRARYPRFALLNQPATWAIATYRFGRYSCLAPQLIRPIVHGLYFGLYSIVRLVTGIDIPRNARFGPGLLIHHFGGIIINPQAVVGRNFVMRQGVTIGTRVDNGPCPVVGDDVQVGAYAQILGGIEVGEGAVIGALSLVISDIPSRKVAAGIPARVVGESR